MPDGAATLPLSRFPVSPAVGPVWAPGAALRVVSVGGPVYLKPALSVAWCSALSGSYRQVLVPAIARGIGLRRGARVPRHALVVSCARAVEAAPRASAPTTARTGATRE